MKLEVGKRYKDGRGEMTTICGVVPHIPAFVWGRNGHWYEKDTGKFVNVTRLAPASLDVVYTPVDGWRSLYEEIELRPLEPRDLRPKNGAWAPGTYTNCCIICAAEFLGDKYALVCSTCAYDDGK